MNRSDLSDIRNLSILLDSKFRGPFGFRFGWDGILGMFPVLGNTVTSVMSLYIIGRAASIGIPASILARMGLNVLIDNMFDFVPILGTIFDFVWKSNLMNLALIDRYLENPSKAARNSKWVLFLTFCLIAATIVATVGISFVMIRWLIQYFMAGSAETWI